MILADSSAWIELLRGSGHPVARALKRTLLDDPRSVVVNEMIVLELLSGAGSELAAATLRDDLMAHTLVPLDGLADYERAAELYRSCRRAGETIRRTVDCLIAVSAMRADADVLHKDRDFDAIARHSSLTVVDYGRR